MNDVVFLADLDDCLFQTMRKCPDDVPVADLIPLGFAKDGSPLSYATPRQMGFLNWMLASGEVIPVTARSLDATRRAKFPYTRAIAANGGVMLGHDGQPDEEWTRGLMTEAAPFVDDLKRLHADAVAIAARDGADVRTWIVEEDGVSCYLVIKNNVEDVPQLHAIGKELRGTVPEGWTYHANGNNIAITPPHIGKARAVAKLIPLIRAEKPGCTIIGIGDSITDGPFMELCDMAMCPSKSQIGNVMFEGKH